MNVLFWLERQKFRFVIDKCRLYLHLRDWRKDYMKHKPNNGKVVKNKP